jgi:hypothetical protein
VGEIPNYKFSFSAAVIITAKDEPNYKRENEGGA